MPVSVVQTNETSLNGLFRTNYSASRSDNTTAEWFLYIPRLERLVCRTKRTRCLICFSLFWGCKAAF